MIEERLPRTTHCQFQKLVSGRTVSFGILALRFRILSHNALLVLIVLSYDALLDLEQQLGTLLFSEFLVDVELALEAGLRVHCKFQNYRTQIQNSCRKTHDSFRRFVVWRTVSFRRLGRRKLSFRNLRTASFTCLVACQFHKSGRLAHNFTTLYGLKVEKQTQLNQIPKFHFLIKISKVIVAEIDNLLEKEYFI